MTYWCPFCNKEYHSCSCSEREEIKEPFSEIDVYPLDYALRRMENGKETYRTNKRNFRG